MEKLAEANRKTTLFAQIETREGVDNAAAIAALDGVDCLWVGHFDLSCSLGIPGQFDHKDFTDAIGAVAKACKKHKKSLGRLVPTVDDAVALYGQGFDFICYSGDVWALQGAISAGLTEIRQRTGKRAGRAGSKARAGKKKGKK
jgi:2-keto-3-deoxy-L-rhamnonate aldolase RhmA